MTLDERDVTSGLLFFRSLVVKEEIEVAKEVTKNGKHIGWKVYIDGRKFPRKPEDYYYLTSEDLSISAALREAGVSEE